MNITMTLKRMPTVAMQISDIVPVAGEIIMDATSNKLKIGDGKTAIKDLPWAWILGENITDAAKKYIEENICLIDDNKFDELFYKCPQFDVAKEVAKILMTAGVDLATELHPVPVYLQRIVFNLNNDFLDCLENNPFYDEYYESKVNSIVKDFSETLSRIKKELIYGN